MKILTTTQQFFTCLKLTLLTQMKQKKLQNNQLYLQGVTSNKVINVLTSGYPKDSESFSKYCKEECFCEYLSGFCNCSCEVSSVLNDELPKGVSYCKVEDEVRKLSFVFVAGHADTIDDRLSIPDSRGCSIYHGSFRSVYSSYNNIQGMVPAYLIVFNI